MRSGAPGPKNRLREAAWLALLAVPGLAYIALMVLDHEEWWVGFDGYLVKVEPVLLAVCMAFSILAWRTPGPWAVRVAVLVLNLLLPCLLLIGAYAY